MPNLMDSDAFVSPPEKRCPWTDEQRKEFGDALGEWLKRKDMSPNVLADKLLLTTGKKITGMTIRTIINGKPVWPRSIDYVLLATGHQAPHALIEAARTLPEPIVLDRPAIARATRIARHLRGISMEDLSLYAGISRQSLSRFENNGTGLPDEMVGRIPKELGYASIDDMLKETKGLPEPTSWRVYARSIERRGSLKPASAPKSPLTPLKSGKGRSLQRLLEDDDPLDGASYDDYRDVPGGRF